VSRIGVLHLNVPNMIGKITGILAAHNMNITDMLNKSKGENAYTLIDLESELTEEITSEISKIEGVLKVRVI
jgi:D-3-phosphoglycerate dehydrogenase / 2-oxoglutarate reductase